MSQSKCILAEATNINLSFGHRAGLKNVSIRIRPSEIVTLIGPNGAGKTTLVRILLGLIKPDSGHVQKSKDLTVGYVPQKLASGTQMPMTVSRFLNMACPASDEEIATVLIEAGVPSCSHSLIEHLSGGELQRIHIARALLRNPDLLVLDEPTQNVDYAGQAALYELITELCDKRQCGVLIISHDLHIVMSKTDHVLCLNRHICCEGQPEAVSKHPEYQALFGPNVAKGLAVYSHNKSHHHGLS